MATKYCCYLLVVVLLVGVCGRVGLAELSKEDKQTLLDGHNKRRSTIALEGEQGQPTAADMQMMVWDDELEASAQKWADQCIYNRDPDVDGKTVGQNWAGDDSEMPEAVMQLWYNEVEHYYFSAEGCTGDCSGYIQMVSAESNQLGCASADCSEKQGPKSNLVCNYSPGGDHGNEKDPYTKGEACSKCPEGHTECKDGLCTSAEESSEGTNAGGILARVPEK